MSFPQISDDPGQQAHYEAMRQAGESHGMAEMLALRQPPGTSQTDRAYMQGRHNNNQFDAMPRPIAERMLADARAAGIDTAGKHYKSDLADRRGWRDPEAWVAGIDDVRRVCLKRNKSCEHLGIRAPEVEFPDGPPLAEKIMRRKMAEYIAQDPKKADDVPALRAEIIEKHAGPNRRKLPDKEAQKMPRKLKVKKAVA